jgi:hypothetical protein
VIALLLTIIIRARYTEVIRDYRFWNRRRFPTLPAPRPAPICPGFTNTDLLAQIQSGLGSAQTAISGGVGQVGQALQSAGQSLGGQ